MVKTMPTASTYVMICGLCFAVTCVIMQKNGAGLHTASSCFWNSNTDGWLFVTVTVIILGSGFLAVL